MSRDFYLLMDSCLCCAYTVTMWLEELQDNRHFKGVLLREDKPADSLLERRNSFHQENAGSKVVTEGMIRELRQLYPYLDETEQAMIKLFGIPQYAVSQAANTYFLGPDINGKKAGDWTKNNISDSRPVIFSHLGQIVEPWWIELTENQLLNVHSAVLPYGRGIYVIENIAALQDLEWFNLAAGYTIHYIDSGVDTGPIISTTPINDPLQFNSIWELKGHTYHSGYRSYLELAKELMVQGADLPSSKVQTDIQSRVFEYQDFTEERKRLAEEGYKAMKSAIRK